ncbi:uncharacterized protein [Antennarius striatus]|uniref:uncharacterized protein isoform X49 n=1 Tax=Antennarius striatus TaxID=241820 RepID=UPI0035ADFE9A
MRFSTLTPAPTTNATNSSTPAPTTNATNSSTPAPTTNATNSLTPAPTTNATNSSTPAPTTNATNSSTPAPTTNATNSLTPAPTTNATNSSSLPTVAPTTNTPTTTSSTTAVATTEIPFSFTSLGETFTADLMNPSSPAFMARAMTITTELEPFYDDAFPSFMSLNVAGFRNGSIINDLLVAFSAGNVPNIMDIANVLINASSNITAFNISVSSITVNGTVVSVSSGVSHKISLITASFFVLLSWLLSGQH